MAKSASRPGSLRLGPYALAKETGFRERTHHPPDGGAHSRSLALEAMQGAQSLEMTAIRPVLEQ